MIHARHFLLAGGLAGVSLGTPIFLSHPLIGLSYISELCPSSEGMGDTLFLVVDPVGVGGIAFCLHDIS